MLPRANVCLCDSVSNKPDILFEKWTAIGVAAYFCGRLKEE